MDEANPRQPSLKTSHRLAASSFGALLISVFMTPFDVVKTRLQAQETHLKRIPFHDSSIDCPQPKGVFHEPPLVKNITSNILHTSPPYRFKGTFDAFVKIPRFEGPSALWRGLPPTLIITIPSTSVYYTSYDKLLELLRKFDSPVLFSLSPLLAGVIARAFAVTVISPLDLVRTRVQSQPKKTSSNALHVASLVLRESSHNGLSGFKRLFRGLGATLARDLPFSGLYWSCMENIRMKGRFHFPTHSTLSIDFVSASLSGMLAAFVTHPFDVIKTFQQIETKKSHNQLFIFRKIVKDQGFSGLYVGIAPRLVKVAPACGIMMTSYEAGKIWFRRNNSY